ncbi:MAG: phosphate binding protein [Planctomycetaceae bacterium]|nr:phosphate binding protein [Planctomycetaceae bacterium]
MCIPFQIRSYIALACLLSLFTCGCGAADGARTTAAPRQTQITITGASTIAPLMGEIGKRFEAEHPGIRVDVQTGGSSRGVADARNGLADIGMVSRDLKPDEADLQRFLIARDGVCIILHAENPVQSLSREQIISIYTGQTRNWKAVGGRDAPITVVNKAEGRSTLEVFATHFKINTKEIHADVVIGDNEQGVKTVAGNPLAIGYVSIGTAEVDREGGVPIRLLSLNEVEASVKNVRNGTFPMSRTLNLVTKTPPEGTIKELIDFASSSKVHDLVKELSFVPID